MREVVVLAQLGDNQIRSSGVVVFRREGEIHEVFRVIDFVLRRFIIRRWNVELPSFSSRADLETDSNRRIALGHECVWREIDAINLHRERDFADSARADGERAGGSHLSLSFALMLNAQFNRCASHVAKAVHGHAVEIDASEAKRVGRLSIGRGRNRRGGVRAVQSENIERDFGVCIGASGKPEFGDLTAREAMIISSSAVVERLFGRE